MEGPRPDKFRVVERIRVYHTLLRIAKGRIPPSWGYPAFACSGSRPVRVAFADFSAAPWQGFEKSERGPSLGSLFPPQAAVASAAVRVLYRHHEKSPQAKGLAASFLVDIPSRWEPRAKQSRTVALLTALCAAALFESCTVLL